MPEVSHTPRAFFCTYAGTRQCLTQREFCLRCRFEFMSDSAGVPASFSAFAAASAQVAPLSRHLPRHRRRLRRFLGIYRDIGAGCAALKAFAAASAQVAPLSRHLPRHRRRLRRSLGICRGVGAGCAALKAFAAASAGVPASLSAFAAADREKCADRWVAERDCLRRTHVINHRSLTAHPRSGGEKADCKVWQICK